MYLDGNSNRSISFGFWVSGSLGLGFEVFGLDFVYQVDLGKNRIMGAGPTFCQNNLRWKFLWFHGVQNAEFGQVT